VYYCRHSICNIEGEDINVELGSNYNESDGAAVLILHLNHVHNILRHLVNCLARSIYNLQFARLHLRRCTLLFRVVEVEELARNYRDTDSLFVIQANNIANLVFHVAKIACLFTAETHQTLVP